MAMFVSQADVAMQQHAEWVQVERPKTQLVMPIPSYERSIKEEDLEEIYLDKRGEAFSVSTPGVKTTPGYEPGKAVNGTLFALD